MKKILLVIIVSIFASCSKDEAIIDTLEKGTSTVKVENGYLKFRDQKVLDSISNLLLSKSPKELVEWEKQFTGFKSYNSIFKDIQVAYDLVNDNNSYNSFKEKYDELVSLRVDSSLTYKFGTPLSSYFINKDGEVKVGNDLRKYTKTGTLIIKSKNNKNNEIKLNIPNFEKILNSKKDIPNEIAIGPNGPNGFVNGIVSQALYYNSSNDRRLYVQLWYEQLTPDPPGSERGTGRFYFIVLQELKRTFGGWRANNTDYYQNSINWSWTLVDVPLAPITEYFSSGSIAYPNTTGPVLFGMRDFLGGPTTTWGTASFTTGGVPSAPNFIVQP